MAKSRKKPPIVSPALLDGELVTLLESSDNTYYVKKDGEEDYMRDEVGKYIRLPLERCLEMRKIYCGQFLEKEKADKVAALVTEWTDKVKGKIHAYRKEVTDFEKKDENDTMSLINKGLKEWAATNNPEGLKTVEERQSHYADYIKDLKQVLPKLDEMFEQGQIISLLEIFRIKRFNNPMLTVSYSDEAGIELLKNVFGAKALYEWDGDMTNRYAAIEIEKEYI